MAPALLNQGFFEDIYCATFNGMSRFLGRVRMALAITDQRAGISCAFDPDNLLASFGVTQSVLRLVQAEPPMQAEPPPFADGRLLLHSKVEGSFTTTWVLERSPTLRNDGPVEQWLKEATTLSNMGAGKPISLELRRSTRDTLLSFAPSAVKRAVQGKTKTYVVINPIDVVLNLTLAYEEGKKCSGNITFYDGANPSTDALCLRLHADTRPLLTATKHLRKLITSVENSPFSILTNNIRAVGILDGTSDHADARAIIQASVAAVFTKGRADIGVDCDYLCSAYEGQLFSQSAAPSRSAIRQLLQNVSLLTPHQNEVLTEILNSLVGYVQTTSSGCSLVLDAAPTAQRLAGDYLDVPLDLNEPRAMKIASRMAKIDGALHLRPDGELLAFGCLLDGRSCSSEDRARGARYNSAIRFTNDNPQSFIVTVSSDGPLSCFYRGRDLTRADPLILTQAQLIELP